VTQVQEEVLREACVAQARELVELLEREAEVLRSFNNRELMEILPRREFLTGEFLKKIHALKNLKDSRGQQSRDVQKEAPEAPQYTVLKGLLKEIQDLNRANRVFIEGSLTYFQDLMECLYPSSHGYGQAGQNLQRSAALKGVGFRKEI